MRQSLNLSFNLISMHIGLYVEYSLIYLIAGVGTAVSLMLVLRHNQAHERKRP